jgi:hypothetical protein
MWQDFEARIEENESERPIPLRKALFEVIRGSGLRTGQGVTKKMVAFEFGHEERLLWEIQHPAQNFFLHKKWQQNLEQSGFACEARPYRRGMKDGARHSALSRSWSFDDQDCIAEVPPSALRWEEIVLDRTNRRWQELLGMARLFLLNRYQTTTGGAGQGTALLFEMNSLFEEYVGRLISRTLAGTGLTVSLQGGRLFCLASEATERGLFQTKPDILIRRAGVVTHVIDTKWKRISSRVDDPKQGVSQGDVYQMMAYAQLYRAPRLTLLYPHHAGLGDEEDIHARHRLTGHDTILETASFDVSKGNNVYDRIRRLVLSNQALSI